MHTADLTLRKLDPFADLDALQTLLERAPRYSLNVSGEPQQKHAAVDVFSALPENFDRSRKYVYGVYLESELVGCVDVLRGFPIQTTAMIGLLLLSENQQGKGLGKIAYRTLESTFADWKEITRIRISVVETNGEVMGFWKRLGFEETGARLPYENGSIKSVAIILEKPANFN